MMIFDMMIQQANNQQSLIINKIAHVIQLNSTNKSNSYFLIGLGTEKKFV